MIRTAGATVRSGGPSSLTTRSLARAVGTSHNGPQIHFHGGLAEILAIIATQGFEELTTTLNAEPVATGADRLRQLVRRYIDFARRGVGPNLYRTMYSPLIAERMAASPAGKSRPISRASVVALDRAKADTYQVFISAVDELQRDGTLLPGSADRLAKALTSAAHGLAGEIIDEGLGQHGDDEPERERRTNAMVETVLDALLYGLVVRG